MPIELVARASKAGVNGAEVYNFVLAAAADVVIMPTVSV